MRVAHSSRGLHNVPAEVTSFIGRRGELAEVKRLLGTTRLLTLTGPGGVGKTRLALRAATDLQRAFVDGIWLVDLAPLQDPALVAQAVHQALGLRDQSARWMMATITDHLADQNVMLVIDNCEHVVSACAVLADALLRGCPPVRILATSRQPLGITGEVTLEIPSMTLPPSAHTPLDSPLKYEAIGLFADRARAVVPGFQLTAGNQDAVIQLCRRLDGMPLAIELAAVRLKVLGVEQIVERLDDRFRLLTAGSRTALARQQTLQATIEWSYDLLTDNEKKLWLRLAVFAGGFDVDAAETVCAGDGIAHAEVFDLLAGLLDKSILQREEVENKVRYRLLETIRQFGLDKLLEAGEANQVRARHRDWVHGLVVGRDRRGLNRPRHFDQLQLDHDNLRAALDFSLTGPREAEVGLAIAASLWPYWAGRGHLSEGRRWIDALLAAVPETTPVRANGLAAAGNLALMQGDLERGMQFLEESRAGAERDGNSAVVAFSLQYLGLASLFQGNRVRAMTLLSDALAMQREAGDRPAVAATLGMLAMTTLLEKDPRGAIAMWDESHAISRETGDQWVLSYTLWGLGIGLWLEGDPARAAEIEKDGLRLKHALDERLGIALCMETLAWIAMSQGNALRAAYLLGAARANWDASGAALFDAFTVYHRECEAHCRADLRAGFDSAFRKGADVSLEEAIGYALEERVVPPGLDTRAQGLPALSRREVEIARLVGQGLSNKEISSKLVISERTAETHVQNILNKLGFRSRSEVAAWITARDAAPTNT